MRNLLPVFVLMSLSCGMPEMENAGEQARDMEEKNGDRLRAMWMVASDGTQYRVDNYYYDTRLKQPCAVLQHQGLMLCMPTPTPQPVDPSLYVRVEYRHE